MKGYVKFILVLMSCQFICSCAPKRTDEHHSENLQSWPEMEAFHDVMAKVFHPYKDSEDLKPAKMYSTELLTAAETWERAPLPKKVNSSTTTSMLKELTEQVRMLSEKVKTNDDEAIKSSLSTVHDTFHKIMERWEDVEDKH